MQRLPEQCLWLFRKTLFVAEISFLNPCNEQRERLGTLPKAMKNLAYKPKIRTDNKGRRT